MFGSPVLDIAIGLIFIFLIYSLLATTVMELLASIFGLRARLLRSTIYRMLNDDQRGKPWSFMRFKKGIISVICFFVPPRWSWFKDDPSLAWAFYNMPGIKYLGLNNWFKRPSYINPERFSKTICDILKESATEGNKHDDEAISEILDSGEIKCGEISCRIDPETHRFLRSLWAEKPTETQSHEEKFRQQLVDWYDETMELLIGRYKRRMQYNTLVLGFAIAVVFNVNTIEIASRLSTNDDAREAMVQLAGSWIESKGTDTSRINGQPDSAASVNKLADEVITMLKEDIRTPNNLLALGYGIPDDFQALKPLAKPGHASNDIIADTSGHMKEILVSKRDSIERMQCLQKVYDRRCKLIKPKIITSALSFNRKDLSRDCAVSYSDKLKLSDRIAFVFYRANMNYSIFGFLLTAIAISFGAPFWFDLLNKVVKIKNEGKKP